MEHNSGKVISTKKRIPFELVYFEFGLNLDMLFKERNT